MKLLVFVPMYRCAEQIKRVVAQFDHTARSKIAGVVFIDNGSPDHTKEACEEAARNNPNMPPWRVFLNDGNYNLGGSHKVAFDLALKEGYDGVVVLHGDDQARLQDLWPHFDKTAECLLGSRFMRGARLEGYSYIRRWGNHAFNLLFSLATFHRLSDLGSGLNYYSAEFLKRDLYKGCPDSLSFNYQLLLASCADGASLRFFPISWREEDQRSNVKMTQQALGMVKLLARFRASPKAFLTATRKNGEGRTYPSTVVARGPESA